MIFTFLLFAWLSFATHSFFFGNPLPFPDKGHRVFAVKDNNAAVAVESILSTHGVSERFTFSPPGSTQTLMWDGKTVLIQHDSTQEKLPPNGISLPSDNPYQSAQQALLCLESKGFSGKIHTLEEGRIVLLESNACIEWALVFRLPLVDMGQPPNKRQISK